MSVLKSHLIYEFGDFRLDASRRLLFAKGASEPLPITPKVFETILYFVERPSELLKKDKLLAELWPGLVVEENNLTQVISVVRRVLGETRGENRYLATTPGHGYRFVAEVFRLPDTTEANHQTPAFEPAGQLRVGRPRRIKPFALVALTVGAFGAALFAYGRYAGWWAAREAAEVPAANPAVALTELPPRTVAVLQFENLSADAGDEFVAFGVAESVLHRLASIQDLTLIARTSSFAFRDKPADARDIGRTLNARYLVEGSVHRAGDRLRVTAQLIDAATGVHVWSLRFDRTIDDIFAVEDEISQGVARALEVSLSEDEHPFARYGTEAYLAFLQGRALMATRRLADAQLAIERFSRALELAPHSATAHAALAEAHIFLAELTGYAPAHEREFMAAVQAKAEPLLTRALQLDDSLGEAYVWRGWLKMGNGDKTGALADYEKGIALSPNYAPGLQRYAEELDGLGRGAEALALIDRARRVDPLHPRSHYYKGLLMLDAGSLAEAEALFLQSLRVAPDYYPALHRLGTIRVGMGRYAEAVSYSERAVASEPRAVWVREMLSMLYLELNDPEAARHLIAELPDAPPEAWIPICLYENDLEGARNILRGFGLEDLSGNQFTDPYVVRAVRDQALVSGDLRARKLMQAVAEKWDPTVGQAKWRADSIWQIDFILVAAQWRKSIGELRSAEASARAVLELIELEKRKPGRQDSLEGEHILALAILGRRDAAIAALERAFADGKRGGWNPDREPAFAAFRDDPRFRALTVKQRAHVSAQRKLLEQMRRDGIVPLRTMSASIASPC
jgi:TolB-like protein/DNA-binding winged helix-turn-helix (wHTH) protein/Flp pilus assembly protein TadD